MYVLGISCYYHDSAAAIIHDGHVIAAAEEERFSRKKFDDEFPKNAIEYCMNEAKISANDLELVAFYDKSILKFERLVDNYVAVAPRGLRSFLNVIPKWLHKRLWIKDEISNNLNYNGKIVFPEHHLSHAATAFFPSGFDNAAILTVDGVGEWSTTTFGIGNKNEIKLTNDIRWPHSLGLFYSAFTYFLGFNVNEGEYKLMGLSSYGEPKYYDLIMNELIDVKDDGSFRLNMKYFAFTHDNIMINSNFEKLFGCVTHTTNNPYKQIHFDIAKSIQLVTENILLKMVDYIYLKTGMKNLCLSGGVALNGVANYRILNESKFDYIYIPSSPGDAGSAIGSALIAYHSILNKPRDLTKPSSHLYLGPSYQNNEIEQILKSKSFFYKKFEFNELFSVVAKLIDNQNIVGWFQGRMEWGPRALGNRSILADPRNNEMKDILNKKIKHREEFRPFAPSVLEEYAENFFDINTTSPHMQYVSNVKTPDLIPAVTHIDGTSRLQTVSKKINPRFYSLIHEFFSITGIPLLINTSMNVMGEPIVNTPQEALEMLNKTEMDYMVIENYLISKNSEL